MTSAPARYLAALEAFEAALASGEPCLTAHFRFAGQPVRLRVAGGELGTLIAKPFAHLREDSPNETPALTIDLWDEAACSVPAPKPMTQESAEARWDVGEGYLAAYNDGGIVEVSQPRSLTWLDRKANQIVGCRSSAATLPVDERSKPVSTAIYTWYYGQGIHIVHSGLIARNGNGVLIGGATGSGKTTTSLSCVIAGFDYLGDDHVGLEACDDGSFRGHSLFNCSRVEPHHLQRFPELLPYAWESNDPEQEKHLILVSQAFPDRLVQTATIKAIVLPRVSGLEESSYAPVSRPETLLQLAPSSVKMTLGSGAAGFERLSRLIQSVPCYRLEMGRDLKQVPRCIDAILGEATS